MVMCLRPFAAAAAKPLQSCPTLCNPIDGSPPGSPVPGILQARTLEWVAISFSNAWKWKVKVKSLSHVRLLATAWSAAYQAPPPMGVSRQEYWSGVPLPSPWDNARSLHLLISWQRPAADKFPWDIALPICVQCLWLLSCYDRVEQIENIYHLATHRKVCWLLTSVLKFIYICVFLW